MTTQMARGYGRIGLSMIGLAVLLAAPVLADAVSYQSRKAGPVRCHVVTVDLNDPEVKVQPMLARDFDSDHGLYTTESFASMIARSKPVAAINGTFFDKYTFKPIGTLVIDGRVAHRAGLWTAVCFMESGEVEFRQRKGGLWGSGDWEGVRAAVCCGPTLLIGGQVHLRPREEGFRDPHVFARAQRSGVGLTADRKLLLVTSQGGATLEQWAEAMKALGAVEALNLDGGASSALYYRGKTLTTPGRDLTNLLTIMQTGEGGERPAEESPPVDLPELFVQKGEIRIDGTLSALNPYTGTLTIKATAFTSPTGHSAAIAPPKDKPAYFNLKTDVHVRGAVDRKVVPVDLRVGLFVAAVGRNLGTGKPLPAREIAVWSKEIEGEYVLR